LRSRACFLGLLALAVTAAIAVAGGPAKAGRGGRPVSCAPEHWPIKTRWPVKTLSDRDAGRVNLAPRRTTVAALARLRRPRRLTERRIRPVEFRSYRIRARLVEAIRDDMDRDIHLVVADLDHPGLTMITELPDPACRAAQRSPRRILLRRARRAFEGACGRQRIDYNKPLGGIGTITGVAFFDRIKGQRGISPNGIELHPLLGFKSAECVRP
jgi:hypothetical protein